jgi:hypothetical protein
MAHELRFENITREAREIVTEQGLEPGSIDVGVVALATNHPTVVLDAALDYRMAPRQVADVRAAKERSQDYPESFDKVYGDQAHLLNAEFNEEDLKLARSIVNTADRLKIPARRRGRIRLFVASIAVGAAVLLVTSHGLAKGHDRAIATGEVKAPEGPKRINENFAMVYDDSIWPGDDVPDVPVLDFVLSHVPGVPDYEPSPLAVRDVTTKTVETKVTEVESSYKAGEVQNPVAPHLELTGVEYDQGRTAAREFFAQLPKGASLKSLNIQGLVSDEFNCMVGEPNPEQQRLIDARTQVAAQALLDESFAAGIALPAGITAPEQIPHSGQEIVLTTADIQALNALLNGRDLCDELSVFNNGGVQTPELKQFLDQKIGANRGAKFTGSAESQVEKTLTHQVYEKVDHNLLFAFPGEPLGLSYAGVVLLYGGMIGFSRRRPRAVHKEAQKVARAAGLKI